MEKTTIRSVLNSSIFTALTVAAALLWKDVFTDALAAIFPPQNQLFYKFCAAGLATVIIIVGLYFLYQTETEASILYKRMEKNLRAAEKKTCEWKKQYRTKVNIK